MAAVISDFVSDSMWNHTHTRSGSSPQQLPTESSYQARSRSRAEPQTKIPPSPRHPHAAATATPPLTTKAPQSWEGTEQGARQKTTLTTRPLSPPPSSSPRPSSYTRQPFTSQQHFPPSSAPYGQDQKPEPEDPKLRAAAPLSSPPSKPLARSAKSLENVSRHGENTIKVRDLAHIESFANEEFLSSRGQPGRRRAAAEPALRYEISGMPIADIIEMVAGLLTKITTTNDRQHENLHRPFPTATDSANLSGLSSSVLAFHGKNVPSITILSYLSRIHKYCPTTYEVFLSLLVYFDRMTERVNTVPIHNVRRDSGDAMDPGSRPSTSYSASGSDLADSPPESHSVRADSSGSEKGQYTHAPKTESDPVQFPVSHFFVVDSFNIHRLVIAGVTCASKFFSDVFYTNSRYAKVCSLSRTF
jgi:hypothetical protein